MLTMSIMFDASIEPFSVLSFRQSIRCFHALLTLPTSFIGRSTVCQSVQPNSWICSSEQSQNVGFFWILILASTTPRLFLFNRGLPMTCLTQNMLLPTRIEKKYQVYIKPLSVSVLARKVTFRYAWRIENVQVLLLVPGDRETFPPCSSLFFICPSFSLEGAKLISTRGKTWREKWGATIHPRKIQTAYFGDPSPPSQFFSKELLLVR